MGDQIGKKDGYVNIVEWLYFRKDNWQDWWERYRIGRQLLAKFQNLTQNWPHLIF